MCILKHLNFIKNFDVDPETDQALYKYILLEPPSFILNLAQEKYSNPSFKNVFQVSGLRRVEGKISKVGIIAWRVKKAAETHFETIPMLVAYGIIDMYSLLEEFILGIYRIYLFYNPESMLTGSENKTYRKLYREKM